MPLLTAFLTGLIQVSLVAFQSRQIAHHQLTGGSRLLPIFLVGCGISSVWIFNVRAAVSGLAAGAAYVLGAGIGTVIAMKIRMKAPK